MTWAGEERKGDGCESSLVGQLYANTAKVKVKEKRLGGRSKLKKASGRVREMGGKRNGV